MVVPPACFKESAIRFPTAAAFAAVMVADSPLGVTTLEGASLPLGSAQLIPRKLFVFVGVVVANAVREEAGILSRAVSFFEQEVKIVSKQMNRIIGFLFITEIFGFGDKIQAKQTISEVIRTLNVPDHFGN
ncbi:hypothetical protein BW716_00255 [[Flexibacter] sp. ATCC 35208]|nr:hypothetical protein BW716_00255 [[Flexibacter] sp. ATCC 35208]